MNAPSPMSALALSHSPLRKGNRLSQETRYFAQKIESLRVQSGEVFMGDDKLVPKNRK
jgi:hypothetical protein